MMRIFETCFDNRVVDVLKYDKKYGKVLLLFNHGLGDFILFLPIFEKLCDSLPRWDFYVGCNPERNFKYLHPRCVIIDAPYGKYDGVYDYIFNIIYPEPPRDKGELDYFNSRFSVKNIETITKPYLCNQLEIGLDNFVWEPYKFPFELHNEDSKLVGVHFFGHTSIKNKDADYLIAEHIWNEIIKVGFEPFEIQMLPLHVLENTETPKFITRDRTIRYEFPKLKIMVLKMLECKYFFGVDSGPLYLAGSLIGFDNVLGLERLRKINKVLPQKITILDIENYTSDSKIMDFLNGKSLTGNTII